MEQNDQHDLDDGRSTGWPSVHGPLPVNTPDLLAETSIAAPPSPEIEPTPFQVREAGQATQRRMALQQRLQEEARGHRRVRNDSKKQREKATEADTAMNDLQAYREVNFGRTARTFAVNFNAWAQAQAGSPLLKSVQRHMEMAALASPVEVRRWDIIRWFKIGKEPSELSRSIDVMADYCHTEAKLQITLHSAEIRASGLDHSGCGPTDACAMEYKFERRTREHFGFESKIRTDGFGDYTHTITTLDDVVHLRANLEVRKVRMAHADYTTRFGFGKGVLGEAINDSLDYQLGAFIPRALHAISPAGIKEGVLAELEDYEGLIDVNAEASRRALRIALNSGGLWGEIKAYEDHIRNRVEGIRSLHRKLNRAENVRLANGRLIVTQLVAVRQWMIQLRELLGWGVDVEAKQLTMPWAVLVDLVNLHLPPNVAPFHKSPAPPPRA